MTSSQERGAWLPIVVRNILANPGYMGKGWYNTTENPSECVRCPNRCGRRHRDDCDCARTKRRARSEWLAVAYPPIVAPDLCNGSRSN